MAVLAAVLVGCGGITHGKPAAEKAIARFHELYNQGKLDVIWNEADPAFRTAASKQEYAEFMAAVQRKLGKVASSANAAWRVQTLNLQTKVQMRQNTAFENGQDTESFTFTLDGTNAVLVGYNLQSRELITR